MNFISSNDVVSLRESLKLLMAQRDALEAEADAIHSELTSPGVDGQPPAGLKTSFIDAEGFPRGDIDIMMVKNKRRRLAEINTDHKEIMKRIEVAMTELHAKLPEVTSGTSSATPVNDKVETNNDYVINSNSVPIAKLDEILPESPAATAGIEENDLLLSFGGITSNTESCMAAVAQLVGQHVNQTISITVMRGKSKEIVQLQLVPKPWGGRGLLGCHLSPIQT